MSTSDPSNDQRAFLAAAKAAHQAFHSDDARAVERLLNEHPALKARINDPTGDFGSPPIVNVRSRAMLDVLLAAGADINARSNWWAGGFGLLDTAEPDLAKYALELGATLTIHAAARLGMVDELRQLLAHDVQLVHARGGDGQAPLHVAANVEIAEILLDAGADIDARDVDHESTAAQYLLRSRPGVARFLVSRGCYTDLLMAAALGDLVLAERLLRADPECIRLRVSDDFFPMVGSHCGGTIYQWVLGWYVSSAQVAKDFGHPAMLELLKRHAPPEEQLLDACWLHDEAAVSGLLSQKPDLVAALPAAGRRHLAHAARNNDTAAARLMLSAGWPVDTYSQHHATPLHWAAWHGNAELVRLLLEHAPDLENNDNEYQGTPLRWAIHGSENGWERDRGDYPTTVSLLLDAGAKPPTELSGSAEVQAMLRKHGVT
jgi:ankyrin repeat protein